VFNSEIFKNCQLGAPPKSQLVIRLRFRLVLLDKVQGQFV